MKVPKAMLGSRTWNERLQVVLDSHRRDRGQVGGRGWSAMLSNLSLKISKSGQNSEAVSRMPLGTYLRKYRKKKVWGVDLSLS